MRVLLPPSETKKSGGGNSRLNTQNLKFNAELEQARSDISKRLEELSTDREKAAKALKVSAKAAAEIAHNLQLSTAPTLAAIERYTGVLYGAIHIKEIETEAREWINNNVYIQSALFGMIGANDQIPSYRLSAGSTLPPLKNATGQTKTLKKTWQEAHAKIDHGQELILDFRSKAYAELAPIPKAYTLEVLNKDSSGTLKALNHFNKQAKGDLVMRLAQTRVEATTITEFVTAAKALDLDISVRENTLTLITNLGKPKST